MKEDGIIRYWQCPRCGTYTAGPTHTAPVTGEEVCFDCAVRENLTRLGFDPEARERTLSRMRQAWLRNPEDFR